MSNRKSDKIKWKKNELTSTLLRKKQWYREKLDDAVP